MSQITVEGTAYWAHVQTASQYDKYSVDIGDLDEANAKVIRDSLISHRLKTAEDNSSNTPKGDLWVQLYRKVDKGTPVVVGPDGKTPFTGLIGNGSKIRAKFRNWVSKGTFANGHELLAVQVLELVPYGADNDIKEGDQAFDDVSNEYDELPETSGMSNVVFGDETEEETVTA